MNQAPKFLAVARHGDVMCVRLAVPRIEDHHMDALGAELAKLVDEDKAHKIVFNLGPEEPDCLISVFLAKLVNLQRRLEGLGGTLALAHVSDDTRSIFRIAGIEKLFRFYPDQQAALNALTSEPRTQ
jgi:anti-anti-sigma regulatory factor